jgi:general secretion pathway protein B
MSYILEALKKSERERQRAHTPSLPDLVINEEPKRKTGKRWALIILMLLFGNGAVLMYFLAHPTAEQPVPAAPVKSAFPPIAQPVVPPSPPPTSDAEKTVLEQKLKDLENRVAKIDAQTSAPVIRETPPTASRAPAIQAPEVPHESALSAPRKPSRTTPPVEKPSAVHPQQMGPRAPQEVDKQANEDYSAPLPERSARKASTEREASADERLPLLAELPSAIREKVPTMKINLLAYSSSPAERFAVIDMVRYAPGALLPSGARLVDIAPDGLVLEMNGKKFKLTH